MVDTPKSGTYDYVKYWRRKNPSMRYAQRNRERVRYNKETLDRAVCRFKRWSRSEINYLRENAEVKTAREMTFDLGRSYLGVMMKAWFCKIPLLTEDKKHMRLVTKI